MKIAILLSLLVFSILLVVLNYSWGWYKWAMWFAFNVGALFICIIYENDKK